MGRLVCWLLGHAPRISHGHNDVTLVTFVSCPRCDRLLSASVFREGPCE